MTNSMLDKLELVLAALPGMLDNRERWDSLIVNRRKPHTYRIFTQWLNGSRICLHRFDTCHDHEAFEHPHPWAGAFVILSGVYRMRIGYSKDRFSTPENVTELVLPKHAMYQIDNPLTWHSVIPLEETYTVMLNEEPWSAEVAHTAVRTTKGKDLDKMPEEELVRSLAKYKELLEAWKNK